MSQFFEESRVENLQKWLFSRNFYEFSCLIFHRNWSPRTGTLFIGCVLSQIILPLSKDRVGYIIHVFQSLLSNRRNSYFWQMWLTRPIRLLLSFRKRMGILRNIYWTHHVRFHHFDEVYIIQHERNALNISLKFFLEILQNFIVSKSFQLRTLLLKLKVLLTFGTIF